MEPVQKIAIVYLIGVACMAWGFAVGRYEVFPYSILSQISDYAAGHALGTVTTLTQKIANDMGVQPARHFRKYPEIARSNTEVLEVTGLKARRDQPRVYTHPDHRSGYRAVFGALDLEESFWGGLLLDPNGRTIHTWALSTDHLETATESEERRNLYGLNLFPDGSVIFTQQERGGGIVRVDACSNVVWSLPGNFHHTISPTDDGHFWTYQGMQEDFDHVLARVSQETGEIVSTIDMADVRRANPLVQIFNLQSDVSAGDISHGNDIDPLSPELADRFAQFEPGDLLLSYRTQNLVFVIDPDTLEVKWWRVGAWGRQHDADWEPDGTISVFSNNWGSEREVSDIISIDPVSYEHRVVLNGEHFGFYSSINGEQERSPYGTRMIASTTQGWAFEVDENDGLIFSLVNTYDDSSGTSIGVSKALRLDERYFDREFWKACETAD